MSRTMTGERMTAPDAVMRRMGWMRAALGLGVGLFAWRFLSFHGLSGAAQAAGITLALLWLASILAHVRIRRHGWLASARGLVLLFGADLALIAWLIWLGGTPQSPYAVLLGLVVIASALRGQAMPPLALAVLACAFYLLAIELAVPGPLAPDEALHALLQVSALLLAGGVMGAIARRHERLAQAGDRAMRRHRSLRELHDSIMLTMSEGLLVLDARGRLIEANPAARAMLGMDGSAEATADGAPERLPAPLAAWLAGVLAGENLSPDGGHEVRLGGRTLLATVRALHGDVAPAAWLLTLVDITHLRALEARLLEQERMAALGQMSAMLAHEIRNPVQTMAQGLELLKLGVPASEADIRAILHEEMLRLNRMVNMMLDYSRPLEPALRDVRPCELIEAAVRQADFDGQGRIEWHCEADRVRLDPDHFRLVLDNLLHNALANREGEAAVRLAMTAAEGGWRLEVRNAGEIAPQVRARLFEPFASGRAQGIGLGLAIVRQVCEANGWEIAVTSEAGETCFAVEARDAVGGEAAKGEAHG